MDSVENFLPGLATGSEAVGTGSAIVDTGSDIFAEVLNTIGGFVSQITDALGS